MRRPSHHKSNATLIATTAALGVSLFFNFRFLQTRIGLFAAKADSSNTEIDEVRERIDAMENSVAQLYRDTEFLDKATYATLNNVTNKAQIKTDGNKDLAFASQALNLKAPESMARSSTGPMTKYEAALDGLSRMRQNIDLMQSQMKRAVEVISKRAGFLLAAPVVLPAEGRLSSHFGSRKSPVTGKNAFHKGLDIASRTGTPVYAPADGVVKFAGKSRTFGKLISLKHGFGFSTKYAHLDQVKVRAGQRISRGDLLGTIGQTGSATGPHLHFEIWYENTFINPAKFFINEDSQDTMSHEVFSADLDDTRQNFSTADVSKH